MRRARHLICLVVLSAAALAATGCGGRSGSAASPATAATAASMPAQTTSTVPAGTTTAVAPAPASTLVYLVREGRVAAARRAIAATPGVARSALEQLLAGPSSDEAAAGLSSAVPPGVTLSSIAIADGVAHVDLSTDPGGRLGLAQVVFTVTQFPTVRSVVVTAAGAPIAGASAALTRADLEELSPTILVESPAFGDPLRCPLAVRGTADAFEGTFQLALHGSDGAELMHKVVTATSGSGVRGTFATTLECSVAAGASIDLRAYELSAEDGSVIHQVDVPLRAPA